MITTLKLFFKKVKLFLTSKEFRKDLKELRIKLKQEVTDFVIKESNKFKTEL